MGFNQSTGERFVLEDRWTAAVKDPQKDQWNGWAFFRVKSFNVPGGTGFDHPDRVRGDPSEQVRGDLSEQVRGDPYGNLVMKGRLQQVPQQMPVTPGYGRGTARDRARLVVDDLEHWGVVGGEDADDDAWSHVTDVWEAAAGKVVLSFFIGGWSRMTRGECGYEVVHYSNHLLT